MSAMGGGTQEENLEEKLPEGDKYFGFVNVLLSILTIYELGLKHMLCQLSNASLVSLSDIS
jgi:hypothetical protein